MKIGFCGPGLMGAPMVRRLLAAGHEVHVWNRTASKLQPLVDAGALAAATPAEVVTNTEVVAMCLLNTEVVETVVFGEHGMATARGAHTLIDHSSIAPDATRRFAQRLAQANGMQWIDAPVSGGVGGAEAGTLAIMAGGDAATIAALSPVMRAYSARVTRMGDTGAGQATKLCNQTIVAATLAAIAEAVGLATRNGIDATLLPEALGGGWADSALLRIFVPRMTRQPETLIGTLNTMRKDINTVAAMALQSGAPIPVTAAVQQTLQLAAAHGLGEEDLAAIVRLVLPPDEIR